LIFCFSFSWSFSTSASTWRDTASSAALLEPQIPIAGARGDFACGAPAMDDARAAATEGVAALDAAYRHSTAVAGRPLDLKAWLTGDESIAKLPAGPAFRVRRPRAGVRSRRAPARSQ